MVNQCLPSSKPLKAFTISSSHHQIRTIWKRQLFKGGFEDYELAIRHDGNFDLELPIHKLIHL